MNVIVTGTISFDYIMNFSGRFADRIMPEKIHNLSLSFLVDKLHKQFGGTAGNIAYTLKLLDVEPCILAPAGGKDYWLYEHHLKKYKLKTTYISHHPNVSTSSYFVMTDRDDNQIGSFYLGATKYAKNLDVASVRGAKFAVLSATDPAAMRRYVADCKKHEIPYLYDPAFQIGQLTAEELTDGISHAEIFIGNDYEIALVEKKLDISHTDLITMVPILITTLAGKGSVIETKNEAIHVRPAKAANISDPTGAGDAYRAGFVAGYLHFASASSARGPLARLNADDLLVCGQMGSVAAVYTVEKYGTQTHKFTKKEYIKRYKENFGTSITL